ncbi:MAG: bifunctional diaminohydroxyphosphoribosylaminopyrimidine deaminase/5-amino-6-(5-phosphoribosylamino)uracil reductase RibD, partial [Actinomycetota bacterium]
MDRISDARFMRRALSLALRGGAVASPNPMVGSVVVKGGEIVGEGWHKGPGTPHAEVVALRSAGSKARGSVVFVTLEPCTHQGRTPPCVDALIDAKPSRVVIAMQDVDLRVAGKGIKALEKAGIDTYVGVCEEEAGRLNESYVMHRLHD